MNQEIENEEMIEEVSFPSTFDLSMVVSNEFSFKMIKNAFKMGLDKNFKKRKDMGSLIVDGETIPMSFGKIFLNLLLIGPYVKFHVKINKEDLFLNDSLTQDALENYFNHTLRKLKENSVKIDYDDIRKSFIETMNEMCDLSGEYNVKVGNSVSYRDLIRLEVEDPEANALFHPDVKPGQFNEIEAQFKEEGKKLEKYFKDHPDSELYPFVTSKTGINIKQFTQLLGFIGLKPTMTGEVIPITIKDNFFKGLSTLESYYINSCGMKKALTTNAKYTRRSGYLTRKLELSNMDNFHDNSIEDCGTKHFIIFRVDNERKFRQIIGRHYYDIDENNKKISELKTVSENDKDLLVGRKIGLRSPVTCCGKHVCATCYGRELSEINKNINTGLSGTLKLTEPLTQMLLSAKHLLTTKTHALDWGEPFNEYFSVNMDSIYFLPEATASISFKMPTSEEYDEDNDAYYIESFEITPAGSKKGIKYTSPTKLFINEKLLPEGKTKEEDDRVTIHSENVEEDEFLFKYQVQNNELTKSLEEILNLIENSDHLGITDYSEFVNKFDDLLIANDLDYINSVHIEMISSRLIRNKETGERLDFSKELLDDYEIVRVSKSVMDSPLSVSLSFERINDQLIDLSTYEKTNVSMMDYLFK